MKIQIQTGFLRVRIDEAELARLLQGQTLTERLVCAGQVMLSLTLGIADALALVPGAQGWRLDLPDAALRDYVATLPRKEALAFEWTDDADAVLRLAFEVDVRDSLQVRGARRRPATEAGS